MKKHIICHIFSLLLALLISGCSEEEVVFSEDPVTESAEDVETEEGSGSETAAAAESTKAPAYVYVIGAVNRPGVYEVREDSRVFEVIERAGGFREDAAAESLNLASTVRDGAVYQVLSREEYEKAGGSGGSGATEGAASGAGNRGLVNINTASVTELTGINGIGESRAQAIVTYREENGGFSCIEDIMKVSGIKDGLFNKIKDQITV